LNHFWIGGHLEVLGGLLAQRLELGEHLAKTHDGISQGRTSDTRRPLPAVRLREGWQILAVFQVSAKSAAAIETDVLKWWRGALGLPSYLTRDHMPQGGWTETVAAGRVNLAATVTRICNLAVASPPPNGAR
jgi:hypothetical protein